MKFGEGSTKSSSSSKAATFSCSPQLADGFESPRPTRERALRKRKASAKCRWPRNRSTWSLLFICRQDRKCFEPQALSLFAGVVPDSRRTNEGVSYTGSKEKASKITCWWKRKFRRKNGEAKTISRTELTKRSAGKNSVGPAVNPSQRRTVRAPSTQAQTDPSRLLV